MRASSRSRRLLSVTLLGIGAWGCGSSSESNDSLGGTTGLSSGSGGSGSDVSGGGLAGDARTSSLPTGTGGVTSSGGGPGSGGIGDTGGSHTTGGAPPAVGGGMPGEITSGGSPATGGAALTSGGASSGGSHATGGAPPVTGGATTTDGGSASGGDSTGGPGTGGASTGTGGASAGTGGVGTGDTEAGGAGTGGAIADGGAPPNGDECTVGAWAAEDPSVAGPFTTVTEEEVGPEAGDAEEDGSVPRFTMFRPEDMDQSGFCHPVITWGNGTSATPSMYGALLRHFASHGFVVIASNSTNVSRGDPRPMVVGVTWVLEQNEEPSSVLYRRIDTTHIGATGHSQGAMATSTAAADEHITTSVPIEGAQVQRNLHGPAMLFCGGLDDVVGCDGAQSAFDAITTLPAMYANYLTVDHGSWMSFGGTRSDVETAITAWMRVHLMADDSLRPWFYGATCSLCTDSAWEIQRKNMDQ